MDGQESLSVGERIKRALSRRVAQAREEQERVIDEATLAETLAKKESLEKALEQQTSHLAQLKASRQGELTKFERAQAEWGQAQERYSRGIPILEAEVAKTESELAEIKKVLPEDAPISQPDLPARTNAEHQPQPAQPQPAQSAQPARPPAMTPPRRSYSSDPDEAPAGWDSRDPRTFGK